MKNKAKTKASHLQLASNNHRPTLEAQRSSRDENGLKEAQLGRGCGCTPTSAPRAQPSLGDAIMVVEGGALGISSGIILQTDQQAAIKGGGGLPTHTHPTLELHSSCF